MTTTVTKKVKYVWVLAAFCFGFTAKVAFDEVGADFISAAYADVAGMNYQQLRRDRDFKRAVEYIVERCHVSGDMIMC